MKKSILLLVLMTLFFQSYGQKKKRTRKAEPETVTETIVDSDDEEEVYDDGFDYEKYRGIFVGVGPRFLNTEPGTIVTNFTDNSPSADMLSTVTEIQDGYVNFGLVLGYKFGKYSGLSHDISLEGSFGTKSSSALVSYGLGYNIRKELNGRPFLIRPSVYVGGGAIAFGVGDLLNNAAYIQVGETQYFDSSISVEVQSTAFIYGPSVDLVYTMLDKIDLWFNVRYDLGSEGDDPTLEFKSQDGNTTSSLSIKGDNPSVTYNGEKLTKLPYDVSGVRLSIGASYLWNRN